MKNIAKYSVHKPITVLMAILIVILLGVVSLTKLPLELFPDINLPYAVVVTTYEGKNPEEVEADVTIPIEQNLLTISNLKTIQSTSREHFSMVITEFEQSTNMDTAFLEMRESFELLTLKEGVGNPMIIKFDPNMMPLMVVSLSRVWPDMDDNESLIHTTEWVKDDVINQLERIPGVASVSLSGASDTEIQVDLKEELLEDLGLTQTEVMRILKDQNIEGLAGVVPDGNEIRMLYIGDNIEGLQELKNTPIYESYTLGDLSENIGFINAATNQYMKINGKQGISISFQKQSEYGITEVVNSIQEKLDEIIDSEEYEAEYVELLNQGEYIEQSVGSVTNNLIIGSILAVLILFIFLWDIRPTLIVGLAIPISVIGAFSLMYAFDISLNIVSMGGLALGIGMLVDNSIVVIENIYRLLKEGKTPKEAAIKGAGQVAAAITASTVTTIAVFLPIVFIEGMTADLFTAMALTVTFSLLASLIIAITMVPCISARVLNQKKDEIEKPTIFTKVQSLYERVLRFALRKKIISLLTIAVLLGLSIFLANMKGFELLPQTDEGTISVDIEMVKGTSFEKTAEITDKLVEEIMEIEDYETVSADVGGAGFMSLFGGTGSTDSASITVLLKDERRLSTSAVANEIERIRDELDYTQLENVETSDVVKITVNAQSTTSMSGFGGTGIQIEIKGHDLDDMRQIANKLVTEIEKVEGTKDYNNGIPQTDDVVRITVNKSNAIMRGVTQSDILKAIDNFYTSLGFSMTTSEDNNMMIKVNGIDYDITVPSSGFNMDDVTYDMFLSQIRVFDYDVTKAIEKKLEENDEDFVLYFFNIPYLNEEQVNPYFDGTKPVGAILINPNLHFDETRNTIYVGTDDDPNPLTSLVKGAVYENEQLVPTPLTSIDPNYPGFGQINRDGKTRTVTVSAKIEKGFIITDVSKEVEEKVNAYLNSTEFETEFGDKGYEVSFVGENEDIEQTKNDMILAGIVAILLVYMIMAIQFQSLKYPFIVIFTIPLAFTGGLFALVLADLPISMVAMVGLIILSGIVVNNGIVLIDYVNQLREEGMSIDDALIQAGKTRLRPILMTALTTSLALVPMALGFGEGGELLQPLGITAIGGLVYATLLTLIIAPIMYRLLNHKHRDHEES